MKKKISNEQRIFNRMMEHLIAPPMLVAFGSLLFNIVVQVPYSLLTANLAFNKYGSMYTPFDSVVENICSGFTTIAIIIAIPFFIKGLFLVNKYMNIIKKEA